MKKNEILKKINESKQVILWGYSFLGKRIEQYLQKNQIQVDIYWDSNAEKLKKDKQEIVLPGSCGDMDALIIICIGNNLIREKLMTEFQAKGYCNFLNEDELHILFEQVLNRKYDCYNMGISEGLTQIERLEAAISSAITNNFEVWERQLEYIERLRIAEKVIILGNYSQAMFCKGHLYDRNGVKNIVAYIDGKENGEENDGLQHLTVEQMDANAVYIVTQNMYLKYIQNTTSWYCNFTELMQNVFTNQHDGEFFAKEKQNILATYRLLEDEKSREVYVETICNRIAPQYATKNFEDLEDGKGYFNHGIFHLSDRESYVDAGAYTGDTVLDFISQVNNQFTKIYAFELDQDNFSIMCTNLKDHNDDKRIEFYCAGLYDKEMDISIGGYNDGKYVSDNQSATTGVAKVVTLDHILGKEEVTLLKMDIEGSELCALKGSKKIIQNSKPRIAISAYHKLEDIWTIPLYLKELNPSYHFYLRHHGPYVWDTDLYAKL